MQSSYNHVLLILATEVINTATTLHGALMDLRYIHIEGNAALVDIAVENSFH